MAKSLDELLEGDRAKPLRTTKALSRDLLSDLRAGGGGIDASKQKFYADNQATMAGLQAQGIAQELGAQTGESGFDARAYKTAGKLQDAATGAGAQARREAFGMSEDARRGTMSLAASMISRDADRRAAAINQVMDSVAQVASAALGEATSAAGGALAKKALGALGSLGSGDPQ